MIERDERLANNRYLPVGGWGNPVRNKRKRKSGLFVASRSWMICKRFSVG
jgi:hypothetical protein